MDGLVADIRYAVRSLWKTKGSTAIALMMLAGGITLVTAAFTVVNLFVTKPLPFPEPTTLVWLNSYDNVKHAYAAASLDDVDYWRQARSLSSVGASRLRQFSLSGAAARGAEVTPGFFETLAIEPMHGRLFVTDDFRSDSARVVVLGEKVWEKSFGADPGIVSREILLDGETFLVVGVLPRIFRSQYAGFELWTPLGMSPEHRSEQSLNAIGRMRSGVTLATCQAEMQVLSERLARSDPGSPSGWETRIGLMAGMMSDAVISYSVLLAIVVLVLLVVCANLAGLQLARAAAGQKEVAVRFALGATRLRVIRQVLVEGALVGLTSGVLAFLFTAWVRQILLGTVPQLKELEIDLRIFGFALIVSVLSGLVFGLAPALVLSRTRLSEVMKAGSPGGGGSHSRLRSILVVGEIAAAVTLLAGVGLLIRSFVSFQQADPGFSVNNLLTASVSLPDSRYADGASRTRFYREALMRVEQLPGVVAAAATSDLPLTGGVKTLRVRGQGAKEFQSVGGRVQTISPGYLGVIGVPVYQGRAFSEEDGAGGFPVAIVNRKLSETLWSRDTATGKYLELEGQKPMLVVGVVDNAKQDLTSPAFAEVMIPYAQAPALTMSLVIRTAGDPESSSIISGLRGEVRKMDSLLAVASIQSMEDIVDGYFPLAIIMGIASFASIALALAALGLYGVISHLVALRSREIGIRMALGATRMGISKLILRDGLRLAAIGLSLGLACGIALARLLSGFLFGVPRFDPAILSCIGLLALLVSLLALVVPANRAGKLEPVRILRGE